MEVGARRKEDIKGQLQFHMVLKVTVLFGRCMEIIEMTGAVFRADDLVVESS